MPAHDPIERLTATFDVEDLRDLVEQSGPFATVVLDSPSGSDDASRRLEISWKNQRRKLEQDWSADDLDRLDLVVADLEHDQAEAFVLVQSAGGDVFVEHLGEAVVRDMAVVEALPRLVAVIDSRQRTLPHIMVVADRAGADLIAFDGGSVVGTDEVRGETLHIHRGHPGGWSQRRFQQRAENTWERNAGEVAERLTEMASAVHPSLIAIAGDVRATSILRDDVDADLADRFENLQAGEPDAMAEEVLTLLADEHARRVVEVLNSLGQAKADGRAVEGEELLDRLREGRVSTLLVHDEHGDEAETVPGGRSIDHAVSLALVSSAGIVVVPISSHMDAPIAGILRW